jgi:hypothetical protein
MISDPWRPAITHRSPIPDRAVLDDEAVGKHPALTRPTHHVNLATMRVMCALRQTDRGVLIPFLLALFISLSGHAARADVARPAGAGNGAVVGKVHLLGGAKCEIRASGKSFPAAIGFPLLESDELVIPVGEFMIVALTNGHVVRIDEDLTMKVSELVLLRAPPPRDPLIAQLDRLLTKKERAQAERISGVQARRHGGEEMPVETSDPRGSTRRGDVPILLGDPEPDTNRPMPRPKQSKPSEPSVGSLVPPVAQPRKPERLGTPATGAPVPTMPPAPPSPDLMDKPSPSALTLPKQNETRQCLIGALLPSISKVTVEVKLKAGRIVRVRLRGGLVTPACMSRLLLKQPGQGPDETWLRSEIVLR